MIYAEEMQKSKNLLAIGLHGLPIAVDSDSFRKEEIIGWNVDHRFEVMQSTRFEDRNEREVFFGDILEDPDTAGSFPRNDRWLVEEDEDNFGVSLSPIGNCCYPWRSDKLKEKIAGMLIIGNTYENKEIYERKAN